MELIAASLRENRQYAPLVVQKSTRYVLAGNHTLKAAVSLGWDTVDVVLVDVDERRARKILLADNRTSDLATDDDQALAELLAALDGDLDGTGWDAYDLDHIADALTQDEEGRGAGPDPGSPQPQARPSLADRFLIPPFDVLDARQGWWQDRKRAWIGLGIRSETGRSIRAYDGQDSLIGIKPGLVRPRQGYSRSEEQGLTFRSADGRDPTYYEQKSAAEQRLARALTKAEFEAEHYQPSSQYESGTSIFDPVVCELACRWFCPPAGRVIDPFAGGSVRGLVTAMLGRTYAGNDLSATQVTANAEQAADFTARGLIDPAAVTWTCGDSAGWVRTLEPETADLLFTCPPYLWLERYSDDPADLSGMSEARFEETYTQILAGAARALRPDRFAVIVTGDARDTRAGRLADLRGMTVRAAAAAGLEFQSGAVLVTQVGSLAVRAGRSFEATRTLGRTHQDVLVFTRGSRSAAASACGDVDLQLPDEIAGAFADRT